MAGVDIRKVLLVVVNCTVAVGAPVWNYYFTRSDIALQAGAALVAVTTFTCVWLLQRSRKWGDPLADSMRDGIAASFVVTYLVMVGWAGFFNYSVSTDPAQLDRLAPLTQQLIGNFTVLTGIVVGFYFGTDAVKAVVAGRQPQRTSEPTPADQADPSHRPAAGQPGG